MISADQNTSQRRFGNRVDIAHNAELRIDRDIYRGSIQNIGLSGAFFNTSDLPARGRSGVLTCDGNPGVEVRVVWHRRGNAPGVGLAFDSSAFQS